MQNIVATVANSDSKSVSGTTNLLIRDIQSLQGPEVIQKPGDKPLTTRAQNAAQEEALRRQETTIALRKTLQEARLLHRQRDLPAAARMYERTLGLAKELGGASLEHEQATAMAGWAHIQLLQALEEQQKGEFTKAAEFAQKVLDLDPQHKDAQAFQRFNAMVQQAQGGPRSSKEALTKSIELRKEHEKIRILLRDGLLYFNNRQWAEAEQKFRDAIRLDPGSEVGFYYLKLIQEQRFDEETRKREITYQKRMLQVTEAWNPPPRAVVQKQRLDEELREREVTQLRRKTFLAERPLPAKGVWRYSRNYIRFSSRNSTSTGGPCLRSSGIWMERPKGMIHGLENGA